MFVLSKIAGLLLHPGNTIFLGLVAAAALLWLDRIGAARLMLTVLLTVWALLVVLPVEHWIGRPLERWLASSGGPDFPLTGGGTGAYHGNRC